MIYPALRVSNQFDLHAALHRAFTHNTAGLPLARGDTLKPLFTFSAVTLSTAMALGYGSASARVVLIENDGAKAPMVTPQPDIPLGLVKDIGGRPNNHFYYASIGQIDSAVNVRFGRVGPGGKIALHEGESNYILYVTKGRGSLLNVDTKGKESSRFEFKAGDVIIFRPYTMHHWEAGAGGWEFVGVEQRDPQPK